MKLLSTFLLMTALCSYALAQQDPLYSQCINNPFVLNPAYGGFTKDLNVNAGYRYQWAGLQGSPQTFNANGHISLFDNRMAAGFMLVSDKIGSSTVTEFIGTYAYRIKIDNNKTLSFGLQAGATNYKFDTSKVTPYDPGDPMFEGTLSSIKPSFGAGIILSSNTFFIGLSVPRMLKSNLEKDGINASVYTQHYYLMGSYLFFVTDRVRFKPSALLKMVNGGPTSVDLNASIILYENYQAGILTRNFNAYGIFLQASFRNSLRLGYVFEVPTGSSVGVNFSTHEITLGLRTALFGFHEKNAVMSF